MRHLPAFAAAILLCAFSCAAADTKTELSDAEKKDGWVLLFDGVTSAGWKKIGEKEFPKEGWEVAEGCLHHKKGGKGGDIVTVDTYENFEFSVDWKISPAGNSGMKYRVADAPGAGFGPEMQFLDDEKNHDGAKGKTATGSLYDMLAPNDKKKVNPVGEFNSSKLIVNGNHVEHWLNGEKILEYEFFSDAWKAALAESKFKNNSKYGQPVKGHLMLQDHGDEVWFKNIKIKVLPAK